MQASGADPLMLVPVYDGFDSGGPYFSGSHPSIDGPAQRQRIAGYLRAGAIVLRTTGLDRDVIDPSRGSVVPGSFRTDGRWVWSDAIEYYLTEYGLAPEEAFYAHIVACDCQCPPVSASAVSLGVRLLTAGMR
jgi:hypothetical protein